MLERLVVQSSRATGQMKPERYNEQRHQSDAERVRIKLQDQPASMHRPRRIFVAAARVGRLVFGVALVRLFGFRRALLEKENGEDHVDRHLEELALPVLEGR